MRKQYLIITGIVILLLTGCHRTRPQAPSNKHIETDSAAVEMMMLNYHLAEAADADLVRYIKNAIDTLSAGQSQLPYTLSQWGFWYKTLQKTDRPRLTNGQTVNISMQIYTLSGTLVLDTEETVEIGKRQVLMAVEQMLPMMREKEQAEVLSPWYLGYGSTETENVPPYTNLQILIEVL